MREKIVLGASILAAITASLCCIGPLAATLLGLGSFSAAVAFTAWRPYLLGLTFVLLAAAFYLTYRKRQIACAEGTCVTASASRWNKMLLWIATVVVVLFAAFPYYSGRLGSVVNHSSSPQEPRRRALSDLERAASESRSTMAMIHIEGMTCGGCVASVRQALVEREGVRSVEVSLEKGHAVVTYDPTKVTPEQLVEIITRTGFKATLRGLTKGTGDDEREDTDHVAH